MLLSGMRAKLYLCNLRPQSPLGPRCLQRTPNEPPNEPPNPPAQPNTPHIKTQAVWGDYVFHNTFCSCDCKVRIYRFSNLYRLCALSIIRQTRQLRNPNKSAKKSQTYNVVALPSPRSPARAAML